MNDRFEVEVVDEKGNSISKKTFDNYSQAEEEESHQIDISPESHTVYFTAIGGEE